MPIIEVEVLVYSTATMDKQPLTPEDISKIVSGLDPIDWVPLELLAELPPQKRLIPGLVAQEFTMAALRGTFRNKFPIRTRLVFDLSGASDLPIDYDLVTQEAARIRQETLEMWNQILAKAKEEVEKHKK